MWAWLPLRRGFALHAFINPRREAAKGYCSQVVCPSVTQFSLVLHALWRRFLDHSTLERNLATIYFSSHDILQFCKSNGSKQPFCFHRRACAARTWWVCLCVRVCSTSVQLHRDMGKILNLAFCRSWHHLLTAEASKGNHAISAKTGYYCEGKIHGDTGVVEWSPASNS